ncbi:MAG TPA: sigma-70 family RNA polymerase sigma factor [Burkholderiaceae bacterium]|nr:sigma-70 family RNA polymerase sigma factor [Burkholderiaceae bacterium]
MLGVGSRRTDSVSPAGQTGVAAFASGADDEQALIRRVVLRDRAAFENLYRKYFPRLTRFVERMVRRPQIVGEIVNDTMFVVWRKASSYNGQSKVSTWIFSIAYRTALRTLGQQRDPVEWEAPEEAAPPETEPERSLIHQQDRQVLDEALLHLSAEHRAVIELTYLHECSCREIAQIVGCPVDTVKTRLFYARRRLRAALAHRMGDLR